MIESCHFQVGNSEYRANMAQPIDLSIPLQSGLENPNCYYTPPINIRPIQTENFHGSVSAGGVCNHQQITIAPHGNGTHTECYGHISSDPEATIFNCLRKFHFLGQLITVKPDVINNGDLVLHENHVLPCLQENVQAVILRTLPNDGSKMSRQYSGTNPPYLMESLTKALAGEDVAHLLVDLPSIDKEVDGGKLAAHKAFWGYPEATRKQSTVTELIFVPEAVIDGLYLLNLQVISLQSDASPSKPLLYPLI